MYGEFHYGESEYADSQKDILTEEYYTDLFPLIPEFISEKKEMHEIYKAQGYEAGYLDHAMEDIINQCFLETAGWSLDRWEMLFGLKTNAFLTYEQRREMIMAKLRGQGTTTAKMIQETAAAFSGGDVEVIEDYAHYRFIVRFVGIKGIPRNMQGFIQMLEERKPAHLAYVFEYKYTVWSELEPFVWDGMEQKTWNELRSLKED